MQGASHGPAAPPGDRPGGASQPAPTPLGGLGDDQQRALAAVLEGHHVFLTGGAGVGKSFTVEAIVRCLRETHLRRVAVTASTGTAAVNCGGMTLHSWAGVIDLQLAPGPLAEKLWGWEKFRQEWRLTDVLILDEVSMVDCALLEKVDYLGRYLRGWRIYQHARMGGAEVHELHPEPFGGLQIVAVGDFFQLPPVEKDATTVHGSPAPEDPPRLQRGGRRGKKGPVPVVVAQLPPGAEAPSAARRGVPGLRGDPAAAAAAAAAASAAQAAEAGAEFGRLAVRQVLAVAVRGVPQHYPPIKGPPLHGGFLAGWVEPPSPPPPPPQQQQQQQQQQEQQCEERQRDLLDEEPPSKRVCSGDQPLAAAASRSAGSEQQQSPDSQQSQWQLDDFELLELDQILLEAQQQSQQRQQQPAPQQEQQPVAQQQPEQQQQERQHETQPKQLQQPSQQQQQQQQQQQPAPQQEQQPEEQQQPEQQQQQQTTQEPLPSQRTQVLTPLRAKWQPQQPCNQQGPRRPRRATASRAAAAIAAAAVLASSGDEASTSSSDSGSCGAGGAGSAAGCSSATSGSCASSSRSSGDGGGGGARGEDPQEAAEPRAWAHECPEVEVERMWEPWDRGEADSPFTPRSGTPFRVVCHRCLYAAGEGGGGGAHASAEAGHACGCAGDGAGGSAAGGGGGGGGAGGAGGAGGSTCSSGGGGGGDGGGTPGFTTARQLSQLASDSGSGSGGWCGGSPARGSQGRRRPSYAFKSPVWAALGLRPVILKQPFRQHESELLEMLDDVRSGGWSLRTRLLLASLARELPQDDGIVATELFCTNAEVDARNARAYSSLPGPELGSPAMDAAAPAGLLQPAAVSSILERNVNAQRQLWLKPGAQVVLLWNLAVQQGLANGTRGVVEGFASYREFLGQEGLVLGSGDLPPSGAGLPHFREGQASVLGGPCGLPHCPCGMPSWAEAPNPRSGSGGGGGMSRMLVRLPDVPAGEWVHLPSFLELAPFRRQQLQDAITWLNHTSTTLLPRVRFSLPRHGGAASVFVGPQAWSYRQRVRVPAVAAAVAAGQGAARLVDVELRRCALPLRLAYALTIHRSQGMSISKLQVHPHRAFAPGQVYVALSRCCSLDGLQVVGAKPPTADASVHRFYSLLGQQEKASMAAGAEAAAAAAEEAEDPAAAAAAAGPVAEGEASATPLLRKP